MPFAATGADLVNNFYLTGIQELYHIGNRSVRRRMDSIGHVHLGSYTVSGPGGRTTVSVADFAEPEWVRGARKAGRLMIESPTTTRVAVAQAGKYRAPGHLFPGRTLRQPAAWRVRQRPASSLLRAPPDSGGRQRQLRTERRRDRTPGGDKHHCLRFRADPRHLERRHRGRVDDALSTPRLQGLEGRRDVRAGLRPHVARHLERPEEVYFFSWEGTSRNWKLPADWGDVPRATLYPLTPDGRGQGVPIAIKECAAFARAPAAGSLRPRPGSKMICGSPRTRGKCRLSLRESRDYRGAKGDTYSHVGPWPHGPHCGGGSTEYLHDFPILPFSGGFE